MFLLSRLVECCEVFFFVFFVQISKKERLARGTDVEVNVKILVNYYSVSFVVSLILRCL